MEKRYQVFVSSTYIDLIPERSEIMQALLELECFPAGMELFPAANDTQWAWIKKVIDESDYYVLIVAGRYGSISRETGLSYTEMEYRYALETGKPVIAFLHEDTSKISAKFCEQSPSNKKKLDAFRSFVGKKLCKYYSSPSDLGAKVSRSLTQLKKQYPAVGWIRTDVIENFASADEILKLKNENEALKEKLYHLGIDKPTTTETLASGNEEFDLDYYFTREGKNPETGKFRKIGDEWNNIKVSWDTIFSVIGCDLIRKPRYWSAASSLITAIQSDANRDLKKKYPEEKFSNFKVSSQDIDIIMIQLRALKLIFINDEGNWELTPYGDNYLTEIMAVPKQKK